MNLLELKNKIKSHLVAGYPGLYIQSSEEARVDAMLQDIATQLQLSPKEWNLGYGWVDFFNKQPRGSQGPDTELANSLPALLDDDLDGKLFIIKDARSALENQPLAVARLKQLLNRIQRHHRGTAAVVLVSETLHIPPQIEAQITLLPLPLPCGEEISNQLDSVCQQFNLLVPENLRQRLQAACSGLSQEEIRSALAMVQQLYKQIDDSALALIQDEKEQIIAKSGVLEMVSVNVKLEDVGGLENLKDWLKQRATIIRRLDEAATRGVKVPKGVLIAGMPGCGKSLTAKVAAGLFQLPLLRLDIGSLLGKYVGESEHNMRRALNMAEAISPCILWVDELEKAFVGMGGGNASEVTARLLGYFLTWMQEKTGAVFVIATANDISALPPELLRKGRFDEIFYVGFPNMAERKNILKIHLGKSGEKEADLNMAELVELCRDYSGADIENAINEALTNAFVLEKKLTQELLAEAITSTIPLRETLREQVNKYEDLFEKLKLRPASKYQGLSVAQMIKMADDPNQVKRKEVAANPDCPNDLLEKLSNDLEPSVVKAVYENPRCPERLLSIRINIAKSSARYDAELLEIATCNSNAPEDLLVLQIKEGGIDDGLRAKLASRTRSPALQQHLAVDKQTEVRFCLAARDDLFEQAQILLTEDEHLRVREVLAKNQSLSMQALEQLATDKSIEVRIQLASNSSLPEVIQLKLAIDKSDAVVAALIKNSSLAHSVRPQLLQNGSSSIKQAIARSTGADVDQMLLLEFADKALKLVLTQNPKLAKDVQMKLATDTDQSIRLNLASNPNLTREAQEILACDSSYAVKLKLSSNLKSKAATPA